MDDCLSRTFAASKFFGGCAQRRWRAAARRAGCGLLAGPRSCEEGDVRVTTAFKRLLRLPGASVIDVSFGAEGVIVSVRRRRRRRVCAGCGLEFPRFRGHLTAGPSGRPGRMSVDAKDAAVFVGVPPGGGSVAEVERPVGAAARG